MKKLLKKKICFGVAIALMLSGCGKVDNGKGITTDINNSQSAPGFFTETESGYYFSSGDYFYYSDKDNVKFVKLCNKPDCMHNSSDCNAYNQGSKCDAHFYEGRLVFPYYDIGENGNNVVIASKGIDGTEEKKEKIINLPVGLYCGKMHRNYFVYNVVEMEENSTEQHSYLYLQKLDKLKEEPEVIYEYVQKDETQNAEIVINAMVDNCVFFYAEGVLRRYDIESGKLLQVQGYEAGKRGEYYTKDRIYQMDMDNNFYYREVESGECVLLKSEENVNICGPFFSDGERIYRINQSYGDTQIPEENNGIYIYDMKGNYIDFVKYKMKQNSGIYFVIADDKVFVFDTPDYQTVTSGSYFEKSKIGKEKILWTDITVE